MIHFTLSRPHDYWSTVRINSVNRHTRLANLGRRSQIQRLRTVVFPAPWFSLSAAARPWRKPQLQWDESPIMMHLNLIRPVLHVMVMKAGTGEEFIPRIVGAEELSTATASFWWAANADEKLCSPGTRIQREGCPNPRGGTPRCPWNSMSWLEGRPREYQWRRRELSAFHCTPSTVLRKKGKRGEVPIYLSSELPRLTVEKIAQAVVAWPPED
jgi:hypothetical protein